MMRKFLLSIVALVVSVCMMAAGGDGSSESKAIYFDWENGHEHVGTKWYRVDLSQINGMVDPTLALYLTNLTDESVKVTMNGKATVTKSFFGVSITKDTTMSAEYTIAANDYQLWSQNVKQLLELDVPYIELQLTAEKKIKLSSKKYETSEIVDYNICDGVEVEAEAHRLDALVLVGSCDKIVPGMLMAAARLHIPCIMISQADDLGTGAHDDQQLQLAVVSKRNIGIIQFHFHMCDSFYRGYCLFSITVPASTFIPAGIRFSAFTITPGAKWQPASMTQS